MPHPTRITRNAGDTISINYPVFFITASPGDSHLHSLMPLKEMREGIWCFDETAGVILYKRSGENFSRVPLIVNATIANLIRSEEYFITRKLVTCNSNRIFIRQSLNKVLEIDMQTHRSMQLDYPDSLITGMDCSAGEHDPTGFRSWRNAGDRIPAG